MMPKQINSMKDETEVTRKVERSKAYPGIPLESAITFTQTIAKSFTASQIINRDDIAAVLGKKASTIERDIAAAVQFGLFTREKQEDKPSGYRLAPIFKKLSHPLNDEERISAIVDCFKTPKLFQELIEKYDNHAVPPLKPILIRFHGIAEKAADDAEEIFRLSAEYCGVLNGQSILNINGHQKQSSNGVQDAIVIDDKKIETPTVKQQQILQLPQHDDGAEQVKIRLSNKKYAYLTYPDDLNATDIEILKKEIEKLELIIK
jgi:predicted transcriptional regulator